MAPKTASPIDRLAVVADRFFKRHTANIVSLTLGFLLGCLASLLADRTVATWRQVYDLMISSGARPFNIVFWTAIAVLFLALFLRRACDRYNRGRSFVELLAAVTEKNVDASVAPYARGALAWGTALSLQVFPNLTPGWPLSSIQVRVRPDPFVIPPSLRNQFETYVRANYERHRFVDDGKKLMLAVNPVSFSDSSTLTLELRETRFTHMMFYRDEIVGQSVERDRLIKSILGGQVEVDNAHSFCMHALIRTKDDKVLFAHRTPKVDFYPETWGISVEEQIAPVDLAGGTEQAVLKWAKRLLHEELGLEQDAYDDDNLRALSVFLEGDSLNCSLMTVLNLNVDARELNATLLAKPRTDYEFDYWKFFSLSELGNVLLHSSLRLHPSSGYRLLLALAYRYGIPTLTSILAKSRAVKTAHA